MVVKKEGKAFTIIGLKRLANKGEAAAQCAMGDLYNSRSIPVEHYNGVPPDYNDGAARFWYTLAANQGDMGAVESLKDIG